MKTISVRIIAVLLGAFALLTLFLSSSVILDLFGIREKEGNYVLFVVWANFICSLLYLAAAWNLFRIRFRAVILLAVALIVLLVAFAGLGFHINNGGIYELKTVKAMTFRTTLTAALALLSWIILKPKKQHHHEIAG